MMNDMTVPDLPSSPHEPWVETRAGGLFFVNALLAAPALMVLYPIALRALLHAITGFDRPSPLLDTVPLVAAHVAPVIGWLALPAAALTIWNLRITDRPWARVALRVFLVLHIGVLVYTAARWI